jgi:hypothetical protein
VYRYAIIRLHDEAGCMVSFQTQYSSVFGLGISRQWYEVLPILLRHKPEIVRIFTLRMAKLALSDADCQIK